MTFELFQTENWTNCRSIFKIPRLEASRHRYSRSSDD